MYMFISSAIEEIQDKSIDSETYNNFYVFLHLLQNNRPFDSQ